MKCTNCHNEVDLEQEQIEVAYERTGQQLYRISQGLLRIFCSEGCRKEWVKQQA